VLPVALVLWSLSAPAPQAVGPADPLGTRQLAASRYANGDLAGALELWNTIGEPRIGHIRVHNATRTHVGVLIHLVGLASGELLTADRYARAGRRLVEFPAGTATLLYAPDGAGQVDLDITLAEANLAPTNLYGFGAVAAEALFLKNVLVPFANVLHQGDAWTASYRWPDLWRLYGLDVALPSVAPTSGLTDAQASWERQTYGPSPTDPLALHTEDHTKLGLAVDDWLHGVMRWRAGASFDRWNARPHVGLTGSLDLRLGGDRVSIGTEDATWVANADESGFSRADAWMAVRSTREPKRAVWTAMVEASTTSVNAPFDLWSGAGSGLARPPLLRAHEEINENVIDGPIFGRTLVHATVEYHHPIGVVRETTFGWAAFVDTARAWHRMDGSASPWPVDAGFGMRWAAPGIDSTIRIDLARGLRDGGWALSLNWQAPWPRQ
jgi:hypothetical protein